MDQLIKVIHGSHLYGLNTENSDQDFKGVYMPTQFETMMGLEKETISLGTNQSQGKNSKDDVDYEIYSFKKLVNMLMKGDMVSMDLLFAPDEYIEWIVPKYQNPFYHLRMIRSLFVTSNMSGYLGYIRRQTAKYGQKGSRLDCLKKVIHCLTSENWDKWDKKTRVVQAIPFLPVTEHTYSDDKGYHMLGRCYQSMAYVDDILNAALKMEDEYGHRARAAMENEGIDWKAVSHAYRASVQIISAFESIGRSMEIPLSETNRAVALDIKKGNLTFHEASFLLDEKMKEVEKLAANYHRKEIDRQAILEHTYGTMMEYYNEKP